MKNRKYIIRSISSLGVVLLLVCSTISRTYAQQRSLKAPAALQRNAMQSEPDIAAIRAQYAKINALTLKREPFKFESSGCVEDGLITYLKSDGQIIKIIYSGAIGDGSWMTEFYFGAGKLIFYFDRLTGGAAAEKVRTTEYRLYVKNDKPIRCLEGKEVVQPDSKATESIQTAYKLLNAYQTKNFKTALCD